MSEVILSVKNMDKSFGVVKALNGVSFDIHAGEVLGLVGENGSGKSTVSSIIAGMQDADSGEMLLDGKPYQPRTIVDAQRKGISMIVQELGTIGSISVAQNLFVGRERQFRCGPVIRVRKMIEAGQKLLDAVGLSNIRAGARTSTLSLEDRKLVEIAKAMQDSPRLLIVDETTTALSHIGRELLFSIIRKQVEDKKAVLFISHDLDELMQTCDVLTVLRDGEMVGTVTREEMNASHIKRLMVGRTMNEHYYREDYPVYAPGAPALIASNVSHEYILSNLFFELREGEILGVGGLSSSGMHELGRLLFGIDPTITGYVKEMPSGNSIIDIRTAIMHRIGYVSKNRDEDVLELKNDIRNNLAISALHILKRFGIITNTAERRFAEGIVDEFQIKCSSIRQDVGTLSGGNKQKVAFGKWVGNDSRILILDCPTRGVDVGVKATMYQLMDELRQQGKAILLISEELPELIGMSDRIMILKDGRLSHEFMRSPELSEHSIIEHMI